MAQAGQIYRLAAGESSPGTPWLDIGGRISSGGERGLLGLAFHPDYGTNGRFFVDYTDLSGNSVISEFARAADGTADPNSERVLMHVDQPYSNHNGGMLAFGADGYLYIGFGDGGGAGDTQGSGQNLKTLLGKILRIDINSGDPYGIPASNPFQPGNTQGADFEIWDWGVRNPWRFSFDSESGALFIGDVGQNQTEEVDVEPAGQGGRNYGWNIMEGDHCYGASTCDQTGLTLPVATYSHDEGCAVTGGYVYRGSRASRRWWAATSTRTIARARSGRSTLTKPSRAHLSRRRCSDRCRSASRALARTSRGSCTSSTPMAWSMPWSRLRSKSRPRLNQDVAGGWSPTILQLRQDVRRLESWQVLEVVRKCAQHAAIGIGVID